jgi:hypothetical protein
LYEELFLPRRRARAQQPGWLFAHVVKLMRCVGWNVDGFASSHDCFLAAESNFDFAFKDCEILLEIMAMRRRAAARRDVHIDKAVMAVRVLARHENCVGISDYPDVG